MTNTNTNDRPDRGDVPAGLSNRAVRRPDGRLLCTSAGCDNVQYYDVGPYGKCGPCIELTYEDCSR